MTDQRRRNEKKRATEARWDPDILKSESQGFADGAFMNAANAAKGYVFAKDGDQPTDGE
jgi:hypothetical protein